MRLLSLGALTHSIVDPFTMRVVKPVTDRLLKCRSQETDEISHRFQVSIAQLGTHVIIALSAALLSIPSPLCTIAIMIIGIYALRQARKISAPRDLSNEGLRICKLAKGVLEALKKVKNKKELQENNKKFLKKNLKTYFSHISQIERIKESLHQLGSSDDDIADTIYYLNFQIKKLRDEGTSLLQQVEVLAPKKFHYKHQSIKPVNMETLRPKRCDPAAQALADLAECSTFLRSRAATPQVDQLQVLLSKCRKLPANGTEVNPPAKQYVLKSHGTIAWLVSLLKRVCIWPSDSAMTSREIA